MQRNNFIKYLAGHVHHKYNNHILLLTLGVWFGYMAYQPL